jgi:hypothetical protein
MIYPSSAEIPSSKIIMSSYHPQLHEQHNRHNAQHFEENPIPLQCQGLYTIDYHPLEHQVSRSKQQQQQGQPRQYFPQLFDDKCFQHQFHHLQQQAGQQAQHAVVQQQADYPFQPGPILDLEGLFELHSNGPSSSSSLNPPIFSYNIHSNCSSEEAPLCTPVAIQTLSDNDKIASLAEALMSDIDTDPRCAVCAHSSHHLNDNDYDSRNRQ